MFKSFDILKKLPDGGIVWIEAAEDVQTARQRIKLFAECRPAEYVIFCQKTQSVIAVPWVSFPRRNAEPSFDPKTTVKKAKTRLPQRSSAKPKTSKIIADIVADIARTFRQPE